MANRTSKHDLSASYRWRKIREFIQRTSVEDFTNLGSAEEPLEYKGESRITNRVFSADPPREFQLTERFVDLQLAEKAGDLETAWTLFIYLQRVLGGAEAP